MQVNQECVLTAAAMGITQIFGGTNKLDREHLPAWTRRSRKGTTIDEIKFVLCVAARGPMPVNSSLDEGY